MITRAQLAGWIELLTRTEFDFVPARDRPAYRAMLSAMRQEFDAAPLAVIHGRADYVAGRDVFVERNGSTVEIVVPVNGEPLRGFTIPVGRALDLLDSLATLLGKSQ